MKDNYLRSTSGVRIIPAPIVHCFTMISYPVSINPTLLFYLLYCMVVVMLLLLFLALLGVIAERVRHWTLSRKVGGLNLIHGVVELGWSSGKPLPHPIKTRQLFS